MNTPADEAHNGTYRADTAPPAPPTRPTVYTMAALFPDLEQDSLRRNEAKRTGRPMGPVTAFPSLDAALSGYLSIGTHFIHGSPGSGKTAIALQVAATCGCPALYVTCEMQPLELFRRLIARTTGTFLGKMKTGEIATADLMSRARIAAEAAPLLAIIDGTQMQITTGDILHAAEMMRGDSEHVLIIVDSLHSWADAADDAGEEYDRINAACAGLRGLAQTLRCPVLAISERNRSSMAKSGQNSGAGSRKIEYGAETVIGLTATDLDIEGSPKFDMNGETPITASIPKNRNGGPGSVKLMFSGRLQRFREA